MNATSRTLSHTRAISKTQVRSFLLSKAMFGFAGLMLCILLSAFALIFVKDAECRATNDLVKAQHEQVLLQTQHDRLLLDKNTWISQQHLQTMAQHQLNMVLPKTTHRCE